MNSQGFHMLNYIIQYMAEKIDISNRWWRLNHLYKIVNKEKESVVFKLNEWQTKLYKLEKKLLELYWVIRLLILKARQIWFTTYKCIDNLDRALFMENQNIVITAHTEWKQKEIFIDIVKYAYEQIPDKIILQDWSVWKKPVAYYDSANQLFFKERNSKISVAMDSRSGTKSALHVTEIWFSKNAEDMMTGTIPAMPKKAPMTIETTANGIWWVWAYLYLLWQQNYPEANSFHPFFYPWFEHSDYRTPLLPWEVLVIPDDIKHINNLPIDDEQKKWYIQMYHALSTWGRNMVLQEYPSTPEEAFLTTGNPFFNVSIVKSLKKIAYTEDLMYKDIRIYAPTVENWTYLYWVDTSEWWIKGDPSSVQVRDRNMNLMASFRWFVPADELCKVIDRLWTLWYKGVIWVERNNTWIWTLVEAKKYIWYDNLYYERTVDKITNTATKHYWFNTNKITRPLILQEMEAMLRTWLLTQFDDREIRELFTFIYNEKWKPEAQLWDHDDMIMADAICLFMRHEQPIIQFVS